MAEEVPDGSVIIPPSQVYEKVTTLTDVVTKLVIQNEQASKERNDDRADIKALETRVTALEKKIWIASGFAAGVGGIVGNFVPTFLR
jgi:hypothetical protein